MSNLYGMKTFKFEGKIATSDFHPAFRFKEDDYVMFFKSPILDPSKLISPKGNIKDIILAVVRKQESGEIKNILTGIEWDNLLLVRDLLEKGAECKDHELMVVEHDVREDKDLTNIISAPVYTFIYNGEKFILRALDVIRFGESDED